MTSTTSTQSVSFSSASFSSMSSTSLSSSDPPSTSTSSTSSSSPSPPPSSSTSTISSTSVTSTSSSSSSSTSTQTSSSHTTSTSSSTSTSTPGTPSATSDSFPSSLSQQTLKPSDTLSTTIVPTITTDSRSSISDSAPVVITSTSLSTDTNGKLVTITQLYPNQTLRPNNPSTNNTAFFRNTAAVAGVFILVGLAAASIILWIFFAIRSRRRTQRLDHDTAVSATLAAAGFHRTPLDDDDDNNPGETSRRSRYGSPDAFLHQRRSSSGLATSSIPSAGRASAAFLDTLPLHDDNDPHDFNPYSDYIVPAGSKDGYVSSPPTSSFLAGSYRNRSYSNTMGENVTGHTPQHSGGSHEPLLSSYNRNSLPPSPTGVTPPPQRLSDAQKNSPALSDKPQQSIAALEASATSSVYSSESTGDHRLDPNLRQRLQDDSDSFRDLRDEEDYSRPVLGVRNMPDTSSQVSVQ